MATNAPDTFIKGGSAGDTGMTYIPIPPTPWITPWQPSPQPWAPYRGTATITIGGTSTDQPKPLRRLMSGDVRDLLNLIHDELLTSDDEDHLALAELIEEALEG